MTPEGQRLSEDFNTSGLPKHLVGCAAFLLLTKLVYSCSHVLSDTLDEVEEQSQEEAGAITKSGKKSRRR